MQFKVPQDVQREDTIIGPITFKQLGILAIGGGITYSIYVSLAQSYYAEIWLPPVLITGGLTLAFAFLKIYSLPFHIFLMDFTEYKILPKRRIWIKKSADPFHSILDENKEKKKKEITPDKKDDIDMEKLSSLADSHSNLINKKY